MQSGLKPCQIEAVGKKKENPKIFNDNFETMKRSNVSQSFEPIDGVKFHFKGKDGNSVPCSAILGTLSIQSKAVCAFEKYFKSRDIDFVIKDIQKGKQLQCQGQGINVNFYDTGKTMIQMANSYEWIKSNLSELVKLYESVSENITQEEGNTSVEFEEDDVTLQKRVWANEQDSEMKSEKVEVPEQQAEKDIPDEISKGMSDTDNADSVEDVKTDTVQSADLRNIIDEYILKSTESNGRLVNKIEEMHSSMVGLDSQLKKERASSTRENQDGAVLAQKIEEIQKSIKQMGSKISVDGQWQKERSDLIQENSDLKIRILNEKDIWLQEKVACTEEIGKLRAEIQELKFKHSEQLQSERQSFQVEREKLQKEIWRLSKVANDTNSTFTSLKAEPPKYTDIKFTEGRNPELSSLGSCDLTWKLADYKSTEVPYYLEKLYHLDCPLTRVEKDRIADKIRNAPSTVEAKAIGDKEIPDFPAWNDVMGKVMTDLQTAKFEQNPSIKDKLDATKGTVLRHPVADETWRTLFPKILTSIRDGSSMTSTAIPKSSIQPVANLIDDRNKRPSVTFAGDSVMNNLKLDMVPKGLNNSKVKVSEAKDLEKVKIHQDPNLKPILVTNVGVNNIRNGDDPLLAASVIQGHLSRIQQETPGIKIIYVSPICRPSNINHDGVKALQGSMESFCKENYIIFLEQVRLMEENLLRDDFHPDNGDGFKLYMDTILDRIADLPFTRMSRSLNKQPIFPQQFPRNRTPSGNRGQSQHRNKRGVY